MSSAFSKKKCRFCRNEIDRKATVCEICQRSLSFSFRSFEPTEVLSLLLSVALVLVSIWQLSEAATKEMDAREALRKAETALEKTDTLNRMIDRQYEVLVDVDNTFFELFSDLCPVLGGDYDAGSSSCEVLKSGKSIRFRRLSLPSREEESGP